MLENVARMNGKLDVLGLDFSGDRNGGDGLQLESSPASYNLPGTGVVQDDVAQKIKRKIDHGTKTKGKGITEMLV